MQAAKEGRSRSSWRTRMRRKQIAGCLQRSQHPCWSLIHALVTDFHMTKSQHHVSRALCAASAPLGCFGKSYVIEGSRKTYCQRLTSCAESSTVQYSSTMDAQYTEYNPEVFQHILASSTKFYLSRLQLLTHSTISLLRCRYNRRYPAHGSALLCPRVAHCLL